MSLLCRRPCHRFSGGNIRLLSWFSGAQKEEKRCAMFNQLRRGQECGPLARGQNSCHKLISPPSFWSGTRGDVRARRLPSESQGPPSPLLSQTGLTWRVTAEFTFSETPARPKETESMQLKLLAGHKRGGSPLCLCLCSQCCLLMTQ